MCQIGVTGETMSQNDDYYQHMDEFNLRCDDIKCFVDVYTAALHLR